MITNLEIKFISSATVYSQTIINKLLHKDIEKWFLFITLPSYSNDIYHPNDKFYLFESFSKETVESIENVLTKWLNL